MSAQNATFVLSKYIYTLESVTSAAELFADHCSVTCRAEVDSLSLTVTAESDASPMITQEFLNYALNLSIEHALRQG